MKVNRIYRFLMLIIVVSSWSVVLAQDEYLPKVQVSSIAYDFTAKDTLGVKHSIKDYKGKYLVIDFWASWCGDCRREMPSVLSLYNRYKSESAIEWLGVSFDFDKNAWKRYLAKEQLPWTQVSDLKKMKESPIAKQYGISWIPSFVVIDPEGCVVGTAITASQLSLILAKITNRILLPMPSASRGTDVITTLHSRHTEREYDGRSLIKQDLGDILWSAVGINRGNGNITSPTAMNRQEILVYAIDATGAYLYEPRRHSLRQVAEGDYRELVAANQQNFNQTPLFLVYVGDMEKFRADNEHARCMVYADAGIASENVNLFCASVGIKTCIRATMDAKGISELLQLNEKQIPMLNTAIGY